MLWNRIFKRPTQCLYSRDFAKIKSPKSNRNREISGHSSGLETFENRSKFLRKEKP